MSLLVDEEVQEEDNDRSAGSASQTILGGRGRCCRRFRICRAAAAADEVVEKATDGAGAPRDEEETTSRIREGKKDIIDKCWA